MTAPIAASCPRCSVLGAVNIFALPETVAVEAWVVSCDVDVFDAVPENVPARAADEFKSAAKLTIDESSAL